MKPYMLINKEYGNVFSLLREALERFLNRRRFGLVVYHQEISLSVGAVGDVLQSGVSS